MARELPVSAEVLVVDEVQAACEGAGCSARSDGFVLPAGKSLISKFCQTR
jgi:hypothetical protein